MDPALARLVVDDFCRTGRGSDGLGDFYDPASGFTRCRANDAAFAKLISQLGAAIAPIGSHPARTTGFGGYRATIEGSYTTIDSDAHYWQFGTQGAPDETTGRASIINRSPDDVLQVYSLKLAKGFPFGLELGATFGYLVNTEIITGGADVRIAVLEGLRESIPGYLPDVGVGGAVRTTTGTSDIDLTVASFDAELSKPIHIAGTVVLQPHVGYQWLRIFGDSGLVDLTPNTDPLELCGYSGDNNPATPDPNKDDFDGQPVCSGSSADFNNDVVFDRVRLTRHRINFGAQLRFQMVQWGFHVATDVVSPLKANEKDGDLVDNFPADPNNPSGFIAPFHKLANDPRTEGDDEVTSQWTFGFEVGASF